MNVRKAPSDEGVVVRVYLLNIHDRSTRGTAKKPKDEDPR
jgi:hypothetical protein